jgi:hypothetical protein
MVGYSGTPLPKKLGIQAGTRLFVVGAPGHYRKLIDPIPKEARIVSTLDDAVDVVHVFATRRQDLSRFLTGALEKLRRDAPIWVSWPKKSAKVATDITEDVIREIALPLGLVDIKVCAVDETWSGLKLVIRKQNR